MLFLADLARRQGNLQGPVVGKRKLAIQGVLPAGARGRQTVLRGGGIPRIGSQWG